MNLLSLTYSDGFTAMLLRLFISIAINWFIVDRLYYTKSKRKDFYFTFMLLSISIFLLVFFMIFVLEDLKSKTSIGIGIGLFGIFSIMRYRTDAMPVREMTYLFVIIALSVVNAIANSVTLLELLTTNGIVVIAIWVIEACRKVTPSKLIQYDRIALITPEKRPELLADLKERTGLDIVNVEIGGIDFLRDMAVIRIYFNKTATDGESQENDTTKITNTTWREVK